MFFVICKGRIRKIKRQNVRVNFIAGYVASFWVKRSRWNVPAAVQAHAAWLVLVQVLM